jgi:Ca-activated chloride channel family protein
MFDLDTLQQLHWLRPAWLWLIPLAVLLGVALGRRHRAANIWRGLIAPHLLKHLVVKPPRHWRPGPRTWLVSLLTLAAVALAGPAWQREPPPFASDHAALVIVLDLDAGMNEQDIAPSRLTRAKQKLGELLALRRDSRTALIVFGQTAHRVLPLTDDSNVLRRYLATLDTRLMPPTAPATQRVSDALALAAQTLTRETAAGTILLVSAGQQAGSGPPNAGAGVVLWTFGAAENSALDTLLPAAAHVKVTLNASDVGEVNRQIQRQFDNAGQLSENQRWRDEGQRLIWPLLLLAALGFRRGWSVRW